jgi:hypothetical protein
LLARSTAVLLPLWFTYSAKRFVPDETGALIETPLYPYRWPLAVLLLALLVEVAYKFLREGDGRALEQRRFLARSTGGALRQLQEAIRRCPSSRSMEAIRVGILSIIVDKTKELLHETRDDVYSANLMTADESSRMLSLVLFSRYYTGRHIIEVAYGLPGAGRAIIEGKPVHIPDIRSADMKGHFRQDAPYRSILCLPISCDHKRVGVVNIDSIHANDLPKDFLADHLEPYVQLMGLSLCVEQHALAASQGGL